MNRILCFAGGLAVGLTLGSRLGRAPYDKVAGAARRAWGHPRVQDTVHHVEARAAHLYDEGVRRLTPNRLANGDTDAGQRGEAA